MPSDEVSTSSGTLAGGKRCRGPRVRIAVKVSRLSLAAMVAIPVLLALVAGLAVVQNGPEPRVSRPISGINRLETQFPAAIHRILAEAAKRPVYPYSVVPGGVRNATEAELAVSRDPVVAQHYKDLDPTRALPTKLANARLAHVSYRMNGNIYWTKKKVQLHAGETILIDGKLEIRGRCGNRISDRPMSPVHDHEPAEVASDTPLPTPLNPNNVSKTGNPPADPAVEGRMETPLETVARAVPSLPVQPAGILSIFPGGLGGFAAGQYRPGLPMRPGAPVGSAPTDDSALPGTGGDAGSGTPVIIPSPGASEPGPGPLTPLPPSSSTPEAPGASVPASPPPPSPQTGDTPNEGANEQPAGNPEAQSPPSTDPPAGTPQETPPGEWPDDFQNPPGQDDPPFVDDPENWPENPSDPPHVEPVPEPGSLAFLTLGAIALASAISRTRGRRRRPPTAA